MPDHNKETYDQYISTEFKIHKQGKELNVKVQRRKKDMYRKPTGAPHSVPILGTRIHEVLLSDRAVEKYTANGIVVNIFSQVDEEERQYDLFGSIPDHRRVPGITDPTSTKNWDLLVCWSDKSCTLERTVGIKESYPVQTT
mmetsp:Transcript_31040/g.71019  ORF Transcript_31040/g.71019 Transcript_31040/m.71019 type:complete len:141 (-) Transcript_31040:3704-4126(-)